MWGRFNVKKAANAVTSSPNGVDNPGLYLGPGDTGGLAPAANKPRGERNSFCTLTLEALPRVDHYKNTKESIKRPSLGELHGEPQYLKGKEYVDRLVARNAGG
ncbi:hypothetical protein AAG570_006852 [Ranatra chinensis]|uniref:Amino acid permease N-terminal domain-containing protein n=1 Tax=Ranatra chinensis TaxID=642074 RepID=A0ABD0YV91_9HEMI